MKKKAVKGKNYVAVDEMFQRKQDKKTMKGMKTAGIAEELKLSEKDMGYPKGPRVKPQKKVPSKGKKK